MPNGLPRPGDEGLDHTHTWGRTYWGGALFCLLADVEIRKKTENRFGLRDALRAVLRDSGGISFDWPIDRVMKVGDEATGTTVLQDLYAQMKDKPVSPDLQELWQQLGIRPHDDSVELQNDAPLAATRKAIMAP
jgi:predicted metalloprotease with PDZ domain